LEKKKADAVPDGNAEIAAAHSASVGLADAAADRENTARARAASAANSEPTNGEGLGLDFRRRD